MTRLMHSTMSPTFTEPLVRHRACTTLETGAVWMQAVPHLHPRYGGISAVLPCLTEALASEANVRSELAVFCPREQGDADRISPEIKIERWPSAQLPWIGNASLGRALQAQLAGFDGMHIHGLWQVSARAAAEAARGVHLPYIVSAHGMLDAWALRQKTLRKKLYAAFAERQTLQNAFCLHALTHAEAEDYRRFGARRPIAVVPNGVEVRSEVSAKLFCDRFPETRNRRVILFLGRIHPKKGLDRLIEAWAGLAPKIPDALLVLAGPDCEGTQAKLERQIEGDGLRDRVRFTGLLEGDLKWSALAAAFGFVLPSFAEGFSVAALEALAAGVPVILSHQCHFESAPSHGCGWTVSPTPTELSNALHELLSLEDGVHERMSTRARNLVEMQYRWGRIARQMASVYRWASGGERPTDVDVWEQQ